MWYGDHDSFENMNEIHTVTTTVTTILRSTATFCSTCLPCSLRNACSYATANYGSPLPPCSPQRMDLASGKRIQAARRHGKKRGKTVSQTNAMGNSSQLEPSLVLALALDIPDSEFFSAARVRTSAYACKLACVCVRVRVRTCTRVRVRVDVCACVLEILPPPQILNFRRPLTSMHNVESMASCKHGRKIDFATRSCSQH